MENNIYWSMVHSIWGVKGNNYLKKIMSLIEGKEFWAMAPKLLKQRFPDIAQEMVEVFIYNRTKLAYKIEKEKILKERVKIISFVDKDYPRRLKTIHQPPALLYIKGQWIEKSLAIGVIGSRKATPYGKKVAKDLANQLSQNDVQVISGLARGIDTYGHLGAVTERGGTVAVLGSGINVVYPRENLGLYNNLATSKNSCVVSEFPLDTQPLQHHFPIRNRIISGLADGIVIVEASEKSGSLITTEFALEQGKEVFAVPGAITNPLAKGPHKLIKEGAKLVGDISDILEEFGQLKFFQFDKPKNKPILNDVEQKIYSVLSSLPISIEDVVKETGLPIQGVITVLSILEIKGLVAQGAGRKYMILN